MFVNKLLRCKVSGRILMFIYAGLSMLVLALSVIYDLEAFAYVGVSESFMTYTVCTHNKALMCPTT